MRDGNRVIAEAARTAIKIPTYHDPTIPFLHLHPLSPLSLTMARQSIPLGLSSRMTMSPTRNVLLVVFILVRLLRFFSFPVLIPSLSPVPQISLHSILSFSNESYGKKTSVSTLFGGEDKQEEPETVVVDIEPTNPQLGKANAVFVMLCRNEEVDGAVKSIRELEDRFNHKYHYPWVFLNDVEFTDEFKKCVHSATLRVNRLIESFACPTFTGVSAW